MRLVWKYFEDVIRETLIEVKERLDYEERRARKRADLTEGSLRRVHLGALEKLENVLQEREQSSNHRQQEPSLSRSMSWLVSVIEPMVGSKTPEDFFMEHLLVGMAEFYSRNLSREIMKGLKQRAQQGAIWSSGPHRAPARNYRATERLQTNSKRRKL